MCVERAAAAMFILCLVAQSGAAQDFPPEHPGGTPVDEVVRPPAAQGAPSAESVRVPAREEAVSADPLPDGDAGTVAGDAPTDDAPSVAEDGAAGDAVAPIHGDGPAATTAEAAPAGPQPLVLLGGEVPVGTRGQLRWRVSESFDGTAVSTPVVVVHGSRPGPRLCLTAAVHGDELNGVEVVRRVLNDTDPSQLAGAVIAVPVVNLLGFSRGSRYLPDRRDLNRFFPGSDTGSAASRIAASLFREIIVHCTVLVDFHTGSFDRSNLPQVRGDLRDPQVLDFTRGFGATPVLHSPGSRGMLRLAASFRGIPAVTFEVGAPLRLEPEKIDFAVQAIKALMHHLQMTRSFRMFAEPQATFYESKWVRVDHGGMLFSTVALGDRVRVGQRLGKVVDPLANEEHEVVSPFRGRVIGLALNQVVLPGFAAFHVGIQTSEQQAVEEARQPVYGDDALERMEGDEMGPAPPERGSDEPDAAAPPGEPPGG
ncbi:MAG: succinylglutamate desuccinylase/aspartoacylase family protein [Pseudomonadota bacterium]|jgi:predicted deacylase